MKILSNKSLAFCIGVFFISQTTNAQVNITYPNGRQEEYYKNKQIKSVLNYKNNKLDSLCVWYHENGKIQSSIYFNEGKKHGVSHYYRENGTLESLIYTNNDSVKVHLQFNSKGILLKEIFSGQEFYYLNGIRYTVEDYIKKKSKKK